MESGRTGNVIIGVSPTWPKDNRQPNIKQVTFLINRTAVCHYRIEGHYVILRLEISSRLAFPLVDNQLRNKLKSREYGGGVSFSSVRPSLSFESHITVRNSRTIFSIHPPEVIRWQLEEL